MSYGASLESRATVSDSPDGLEFVMPAPRVWFVIVFLTLWLLGWAAGESFALRALLRPGPLPVKGFLLVWVAFWTLGGASALSICVWMLAGHERVRLGMDSLVIRREAFGIGPAQSYALDRISNLRAEQLPRLTALAQTRGGAAPATPEQTATAMRLAGIGGPGIWFEYQGRPVRFGLALDAIEARQVVSQLQARHTFPEGHAAA